MINWARKHNVVIEFCAAISESPNKFFRKPYVWAGCSGGVNPVVGRTLLTALRKLKRNYENANRIDLRR